MKSIFLACLFFGIVAITAFGAEDGLFIPVPKPDPKVSLENGFIVTKIPTKRLNLLRATLRIDSEHSDTYWIELDFSEWHDPGDFYVFQLQGKQYGGFVIRGDGGFKGGGRWALDFTDLEKARNFLRQISESYNLKSEAIHDSTKG